MKIVVDDPAELRAKAQESLARIRASLEQMENVLLFQQERLQTIQSEVDHFHADVGRCRERLAKLKAAA